MSTTNEMAGSSSTQACPQEASRKSSNRSSYSTPPTSDEEFKLGPARAHFQKRYHEIKPLAAGANGQTYFAIPRNAADNICRDIGSFDTQAAFFDALRKHIVVVKFTKQGRGTDELLSEIKFYANGLPQHGGTSAVPIVNPLKYHTKNDGPWLTLKLAKGGALDSFIKYNKKDLSLGFRWHAGFQLAEAFAYLFYGETDLLADTTPQRNEWPLVSHGDFHTGNILLTSSSEGSFKDYPDIKFVDFGRARYLKPATESTTADERKDTMIASIKDSQNTDTRAAANILLSMCLIHHFGGNMCGAQHCASNCGKCPRADCDVCVGIGRRVGRFEGLSSDERLFYDKVSSFLNFPFKNVEHREALSFLKAFAKTAQEQRDKHYIPLSTEAVAHLNAERVSDEEIDKALGLGLLEHE